jgi:hypothetical protein
MIHAATRERLENVALIVVCPSLDAMTLPDFKRPFAEFIPHLGTVQVNSPSPPVNPAMSGAASGFAPSQRFAESHQASTSERIEARAVIGRAFRGDIVEIVARRHGLISELR